MKNGRLWISRSKRGKNAGISKTGAAFFVLITLIVVAGVVAISNQVVNAEIGNRTPSTSTATTTKTASDPPSNASVAAINRAPSVVPIKLEWCNTSNSGQDRFCAGSITVVQGDIVQIMFIQNDTDAHTFTLTSGPYNFQINDTIAGLANFLQNKAIINGSCVNGNYSQESLSVSSNYCVSGASLLSPAYLSKYGASNFAAEQNPNPAVGFGNASNEHPITIPVSNKVYHGGSSNLTAVHLSPNVTVTGEWGIGAFQASYAGVFEYTCIYHLANGMFGYLTVLPNQYCVTNPVACGLNLTAIPPPSNGNNGPGKNASGSVTVSIQNGSSTNTGSPGFSPQTITVVVGVNNTVTWVNEDYTVHTVTANDGSFDSGLIQPGSNFTLTFSTPGTFQYHCSIHAWMKGIVIVLPHT